MSNLIRYALYKCGVIFFFKYYNNTVTYRIAPATILLQLLPAIAGTTSNSRLRIDHLLLPSHAKAIPVQEGHAKLDLLSNKNLFGISLEFIIGLFVLQLCLGN